ncbi:MAG: isoprenylcysteine carboxylmethyltransferase family protein [Gemmatimonadota bacterium]|nr:isoprenylcysteine carboxylmethyltransferase family protein [Gemmatimonadota bacterium]
MDTVRYYAALIAIVTIPPALVYWFIVHPFVGFWRRRGKVVTFSLLAVVYIGLAAAIWTMRGVLLAPETDYGTDSTLWLPAAACYAFAMWIQIRIRKQLRFTVLAGSPELDADGKGGQLLAEGLYARVRHPRYAAILFGVVAWALFSNYLATYLLIPITLVALMAIVTIEERELAIRFGEDYEEYRRRVPMFIPRFGRDAADG